MTQREIELSREISSHVPWKPQVGDTFVCRGRPQTVWRLPAPCHEGDFRLWGLYEAKTWLRENGVDSFEISRSPEGWTARADAPAASGSAGASRAMDFSTSSKNIVRAEQSGVENPKSMLLEPLTISGATDVEALLGIVLALLRGRASATP